MSVSVENFYWILYENLLRPTGLEGGHQWPFGSGNIVKFPYKFQQLVNNKCVDAYHNRFSSYPIAYMHFDQEPIYEENKNDVLDGTEGNYHKHIRILTNSEFSDVKKMFCQKYQIIDWYYFYHGFAALDWYRDAKYVNIDRGITDAFSTFNHIIRHKRSYRMSLTARLASRDLLNKGTVSFHGNFLDCVDEINDSHTQLSDRSRDLIDRFLIQKQIQNMVVDSYHVDGNYSAKFGGNMYRLRQQSFLHLVNETIFYDRKLHLTEKTFHPIVHLRPFILVAAPGNLEYLRSYGFQTFGDWIDESYDTVEDDDQRLDHIAAETERLARKPIGELREILEEMRPVLEYNKQHFFGRFREIIANELVDNFEACLRIWNNGRVDDYSVPMPTREHLDRVKRLLSR